METGVSERQRLLRHSLHDSRMTMAGVEHGDAGGEVDVAPAVDIPQLGILRLGHVNAPATDPGGHGRRLTGFQIG